ncbi:MAG: PKD domain-containing protein [Chitinophagales bacterium]
MKNFIFHIITTFTLALFITITTFASVGINNTTEEIIDLNMVAETSSAFLDKAPIYDKEVCDLDMLFDLEIEGLTVSFTNKAVGEFSRVEWTFGDGATADLTDAAHTYEKAGIYYFTAIIHNPETGCVDFVGGNYYIQSNKLQKVTQEDVNSTKVVNLFE